MAKRSTALLLALVLLLGMLSVCVTAQDVPLLANAAEAFSDVSADDWFYEYVNALYLGRIVGGYGDGRFRPAANVSLGQALKMILLAAGYSECAPVTDHWASGFLVFAAEQGFLTEDELGDLDGAVSRITIARLAARSLSIEPQTQVNFFTDTEDGHVNALHMLDILGGYDDGTFRPEKSLTRAELSAIVYRLYKLLPTMNSQTTDAAGSNFAPSNTELNTSDACISYLKDKEGFRANAYWDYQQYSIGYGSRCKQNEYPEGITEQQADALMRSMLAEFETELNEFMQENNVRLTSNQYDALMAFTYNTGSEWMRSSRLATILKSGSYTDNELASALGIWCHVGSDSRNVSEDLIERRMREVKMFLYNDYTGKSSPDFCSLVFQTSKGKVDVDIAFYKKGEPSAPLFAAQCEMDQFIGWQTQYGMILTEGDIAMEDMTVYACWLSDSYGTQFW